MDKNLKAILIYWVPVFIWGGVILFLSSINGEDLPVVDIPGADKLAHLADYLIFGALLFRAFLNSGLNIGLAKAVTLSIILASLFAGFDEWRQSFIPNRTPDMLDFAADFVGLNIGILIYKMRGQHCQR